MLLDPKVGLGQAVKIQQARIQEVRTYPNPNNYRPLLSKGGLYNVRAICHRGDTRGQEWYAEITAITPE